MIQQMDPSVRWRGHEALSSGNNSEFLAAKQKLCEHTGIDQGFHNKLLYSSDGLQKWMDVKIFPQGEGPVNTLGAFYRGPRSHVNFNLTEWNVLKGQPPNYVIHNWNGDVSPVVHQHNRFQ